MKNLLLPLLLVFPFIAKSQYLIDYTYLNHYTDSSINVLLDNKGLDSNAFVTNSVESYSVTYNTTDGLGNPTIASGAVYIPIKPDCYNAPILIYGHGTQFDLQGVPSNGSYSSKGRRFAGTGFITVLPDYIGLGINTEIQTYQHAETEATASIDLTRAVRELLLSHDQIQDNKEVYITGYSQGGHTAMATNKYIQENNLSVEFNVVASAPLSGAYDLSGIQRDFVFATSYYSSPAFLPNVIIGYQSVYGTLFNDFDDVFDSPYDSIYGVNTVNRTTSNIFWFLNTPSNTYDFMQDTVVQNMLADPLSLTHPINLALKENNVYDWAPQNPMRILYCSSDNVVSPENSTFTLDTMIALGATDVQAIDVNATASHGSCGTPTLNYTSLWFDSIKTVNCSKGSFTKVPFCKNDSILYNGTYYKENTLISDTLMTASLEDSIVEVFIYTYIYNPAQIITSSINNVICDEDSVFLTSQNYNNVHSWSNVINDSIYFIPVDQEKYYLTETDSNGCVSSDSISFTVFDYPSLYIAATTDTICEGAPVSLLDSHDGSSGDWSNNFVSNQDYYFTNDTSIYFTSYNSPNCFTKDSLSIVVKPSPTISMTPVTNQLCSGDSVFLNATGAASINWNNSIINNAYYIPSSTTNYTVVGTNPNNCTDTIMFPIVVDITPDVVANASVTSFCKGNLTILNGSGADTYVWNDINVNNNSYSTLTEAKYYVVTGTTSNGCEAKDSVYIDVQDVPSELSILTDTSVCENDSLYFSTINDPNLVFTWNNNVVNNSHFTPTVSGQYIVTAKTSINCESSDTIIINVKANPTIVLANTSSDDICENDSVLIWATVNNSSIEWNNSILDNEYFFPTQTFFATLTTTGSNQCSISDSVLITVNPTPTPVITNNAGTLTTTTFDSYQWYLDGVEITNATNQTYVPNSNGEYSVLVTDYICSDTSENFTYNSTSIMTNESLSPILYPNPTKGNISIAGLENENYSVSVINSIGEIVIENRLNIKEVNLSELSKGIYIVLIKTNKQTTTHQINKM